MSMTDSTSDPRLKRLFALVEMALTRAAAGLRAALALSNRSSTSDSLDNQNAPASVVVAAIEATPRASGIFVVNINYFGTDSAADTVTIEVVASQGPVTAFSGGTLEQAAGSATPPLPAVRYAKAGAVTATATGGNTLVAQQSNTIAAPGVAAMALTARVPLTTGQAGLILIELAATHNLSAQTLNVLCFELP
jgi:hypothetical protein